VRQAADFLPLEQLTIMHLKTGEWELFGAMIGSGAGGSSAARPSRGLKARLFLGQRRSWLALTVIKTTFIAICRLVPA
jgi:hypothetical protein